MFSFSQKVRKSDKSGSQEDIGTILSVFRTFRLSTYICIMSSILIKSATIVNENKQFIADVFIKDGFIEQINNQINKNADQVINAEGLYLFPGCIDDQVHFREPGLTYKADIHSESRAAVAGGITSFMEMPNTVPNTLTQELL